MFIEPNNPYLSSSPPADPPRPPNNNQPTHKIILDLVHPELASPQPGYLAWEESPSSLDLPLDHLPQY